MLPALGQTAVGSTARPSVVELGSGWGQHQGTHLDGVRQTDGFEPFRARAIRPATLRTFRERPGSRPWVLESTLPGDARSDVSRLPSFGRETTHLLPAHKGFPQICGSRAQKSAHVVREALFQEREQEGARRPRLPCRQTRSLHLMDSGNPGVVERSVALQELSQRSVGPVSRTSAVTARSAVLMSVITMR